MAERFIERMTWPEVEQAISRGVDAVLIPIGTTEQHGPHMPLDTDCFIARSLCARAAEAGEAEGVELLVAPTLNVTLSWYHMQFPGSLRLSTPTFFQVFREICDSLAHHGFEHLVAVNGHGGNAAALTVAVNHYFETTGRRVFLVQWWDLASDALAEIEGPMIHAEEAETSLAMALGQRVEADRATRDAWDRGAAVKEAGGTWTSFGRYGMRASGPGVVVPMDMLRDITESGVVGDATRARVETGERIVAAIDPADRPGVQGNGRKGVAAVRVIDLSQPLSRESQLHPFFPPTQILRHIQHSDAEEGRPSFNAEIIITSNHAATHVDAFGHYQKGGVAIAEMPLDTFCGEAICVDIRAVPARARRDRRRGRPGRRGRVGQELRARRHPPVLLRPLQPHRGHAGVPGRVQRDLGRGSELDGRPRREDLRRRDDQPRPRLPDRRVPDAQGVRRARR